MDGKKESVGGKANLKQARIQKILNSNFQGKETEIKISYQAEPPEQIVLERTETERKGQIHTEWEISGRTDSEESDIRCHAAKQVVEQHFKDGTFEEAYQKVKMIEAVLITMKENDLITIDQALESIRLASSISVYLCKDGIYAKRAVGHRPEEHKVSDGADS